MNSTIPKNRPQNSRQIAGINSVNQAFDNGTRIVRIYVDESKNNQRILDLLERAKKRGIAVEKVSKITLDLMVVGSKHQGIVADIATSNQQLTLDDILARDKPLILLLDSLQDPHNLGACLRSAAAAGVDAVIVPKNRSVAVNATVSKVACGGAEIVPIFTETNLTRTLEKCQRAGLWSVALSGHAEQSLYEADLNQGLVIMMGNEGKGLAQNLLNHADFCVKIPMAGAIESLNVSVATGIVLFETLRQRGCSKVV
ncbi:MAG: 23S rRNA (guanosine(2251)-2'-O)-methyltransferase RlmB [Gammaproteobacteria bacterium]|nr:MAG: 23S rRNA (guanosine(2251)-2'-O)-methyltransferase RlmB [Gammaproteobacteria bacterium]